MPDEQPIRIEATVALWRGGALRTSLTLAEAIDIAGGAFIGALLAFAITGDFRLLWLMIGSVVVQGVLLLRRDYEASRAQLPDLSEDAGR